VKHVLCCIKVKIKHIIVAVGLQQNITSTDGIRPILSVSQSLCQLDTYNQHATQHGNVISRAKATNHKIISLCTVCHQQWQM